MQATIVALYGRKSENLRNFLASCQSVVAERLGSRFRPYDMEQIHGTVVGLERDGAEPGRFLNRNFKTLRGEEARMEFGGLLDFLRNDARLPFQVQISGFQDRDYPFTSRHARPFDRSFSMDGGNVVVIGWPVRGVPLADAPASPGASIQEAELYPDTLDSIRRGAQRFGVLHAYHDGPEDTDNDFFFRIGRVDDWRSVEPDVTARVHQVMRSDLGALPPLTVDITVSELKIVFYGSEELPSGLSVAYPIDKDDLDEEFIRAQYEIDPARHPGSP